MSILGQEKTDHYKAWLKSLKPGDVVIYDTGASYRTSLKKVKVANITATGRIRLEDGTMWYHYGSGQGLYKYRYLQEYTLEIRAQEARDRSVKYVSEFKWSELTSEDLLNVLEILNHYKQEQDVDKQADTVFNS